jgi:hypothetical protein
MCIFETTVWTCGHSNLYTGQSLCKEVQETQGKCATEYVRHVENPCKECEKYMREKAVAAEDQEWVEGEMLAKDKGRKRKGPWRRK